MSDAYDALAQQLGKAVMEIAQLKGELEVSEARRRRAETAAMEMASDKMREFLEHDEAHVREKLKLRIEDLETKILSWDKALMQEREARAAADREVNKLNQKFQEVCVYNSNLREDLERARRPQQAHDPGDYTR